MQDVLSEVRWRLWLQRLVALTTLGLAVGAAAGLLLVVVHVLVPSFSLLWALSAVLAGTLLTAILAAFRPSSLSDAAALVDRYYGMKDRSVSALQFARMTSEDPLRKLQLADTALHLQKVRAQDCVPVQPPRTPRNLALLLIGAAVLLVAFGRPGSPSAVASRPLPMLSQQAADLRSTLLPQIEKLAAENDDAALRELSEQLESLVDQLEQEGVDERDLIAAISQMQQALAESRESIQPETTAAQLRELAAAMQPIPAWQDVAQAIEQGDYQQASENLQAVNPETMTDKERRALAENLKDIAERSKKDPRDQRNEAPEPLQQGLEQLQQGLEKQSAEQSQEGIEKLAEELKQQAVKQEIGEQMSAQMNQLAQRKTQARGDKRGDQPGDNDSKSQAASQQWGQGTAGEPNQGPATELDSQRQREQLQGQRGEGPSETETIEVDPAEQQEQRASRAYAKRYQEYRQQAEAVLDSEDLPLGHRETVREYFERIRPTDAAEEDKGNSP